MLGLGCSWFGFIFFSFYPHLGKGSNLEEHIFFNLGLIPPFKTYIWLICSVFSWIGKYTLFQRMVRLGGLAPGGGIRIGVPLSNNPFHKGIQSESTPPGSKTTKPNH